MLNTLRTLRSRLLTDKKVSKLEEAAQLHTKGEFSKSFPIYAELAEEGHVLSQRFLGWLYFRGEGVEVDLDKAIFWLESAARQGDVEAMFGAGRAYMSKKGAIIESGV